jgi:hypothetical protein
VLTVFVALAVAGELPLVSRVADAIDLHLDSPARDLLGLPRERDEVGKDAVYHRVYRRLAWLLAVIDPYPGERRRQSRAELDAWRASLDPAFVEARMRRVREVSDTLLEVSARLLPADVRSRWNGDVRIDATLIRAWGRRGHPKPKAGRESSADKMSPEVLAGGYVRDNPDTGKKEFHFGYEAHLAVMTARALARPLIFRCSFWQCQSTSPPSGSRRTPSPSCKRCRRTATPPASWPGTGPTSRTRRRRNCNSRRVPSATDCAGIIRMTNSA